MIEVLIAIADPVVGAGLRSILDRAGDCACVGMVGTGEEVLAAADGFSTDSPGVVILDVAFRRADADLLPALQEMDPAPAVLIYVDHGPDECVVQRLLGGAGSRLSSRALARLDDCCLTSLRQDAGGCLARGSDPETVVESVRRVARGEIVAGPWLTTVARGLRGGRHGGEPAAISPRELEVMAHLAEGLSNKEIARRMGIQEQTVKNHVSRTMSKLGLDSRLEVGLLAAKHKLRLAE